MAWFTLYCGLILLCWPHVVIPDTFTSIATLRALVENEEWLTEQISEYLTQEEERLLTIRSHMKEIEKWTDVKKSMSEDVWNEYVTGLVEHPINAFNLVKSWVEVSKLTDGASHELFSAVTRAANTRGLGIPGEEDYKGGIAALIRLQKTYSIPTTDLAEGKIRNVSAAHGLDTNDYFEMGKMLLQVDHSLAISWFQRMLAEGVGDFYTEREVHKHMSEIYKKAGDFERALNSALQAQAKDPNNRFLQSEIPQLRDSLTKAVHNGEQYKQHFYWKNPRDKNLEYYESLCRGDDIKNDIRVTKDLICIYRKGAIPYVQYKEEIHNFDPRISLFIDVITDKQAEMLKQKAFPGLYRAHVGDPSKSVTSDERVSKLSWLWDTDKDVERISNKVSHITGLSTAYKQTNSHAEAFQIVNYGMGGQYEPHYDFYEQVEMLERLPSFILGTGDRISTFMFYLCEPGAGGATVFPNLGVRVPPIKNSAAFWYNFNLSGDIGDRRTLHAGCPVLMGQKWVANKWIRQTGQVFKRPCALDEHQIDPIWYS